MFIAVDIAAYVVGSEEYKKTLATSVHSSEKKDVF